MADCLRKKHLNEWLVPSKNVLFFEAKFECGRVFDWFFDKWVGLWQFLLRGSFLVSQGSS